MYYLKLLNWTKSYFPNVQKRDERDKEKKKDILLTFSALSMILTMAVRSSNLPAAVKAT